MSVLFYLCNFSKNYSKLTNQPKFTSKGKSIMAQKLDSKQPTENNLDINKIMKIVKNDDELAK